MQRLSNRVFFCALALVLGASAFASAASYNVTVVPGLGGPDAESQGINNAGWMTGWFGVPGEGSDHAFLFNGALTKDLGTLPGYAGSFGYGINDAGEVVSDAYTPTGRGEAFLYDGSSLKDLGALSGDNSSSAFGINSSGQISGISSSTTIYDVRAYIYQNGSMRPLVTSSDEPQTAYGLNALGWVTGMDNAGNAYIYDGTTIRDLGLPAGYRLSTGYAINSSGQVTGGIWPTTGDSSHALLFDGTSNKDLGTLGGTQSYGYSINSSGVVVGSSSTASGQLDGFVYSNGVLQDLNALIPANLGIHIGGASGINDAGQIAASGTDANGNQAVFLLTPTPEPTGIFMLAVGGTLLLRRRSGR